MSRFAFLKRHWKVITLGSATFLFLVAVGFSIWFAPKTYTPSGEGSSSSVSAESSQSSAENNLVTVDNAGKQLTDLYSQAGVNLGFLHSTRFDDFSEPFPLQNRAQFSQAEAGPDWQPTPLSTLIKPVTEPQNQGQLQWEEFGINTPVLYAPFSDLFVANGDGTSDFAKSVDTSSINSPIQQRLRNGIVHLPFSPLPGEVGNSYIIGHTSNFINVESDYNEVFAPLLNAAKPGQEFTITDHRGRLLKFRVFEVLAVTENDLTQAYKNFGDRRIVTLQGSILENGIPTKRYLVRAELLVA